MKINLASRSEEEFTRSRVKDPLRVFRNLDSNLHPFTNALEYSRALNAAKLKRMFAKPFISALEHRECVTCIAKNTSSDFLLTGSADGEIRLWDVSAKSYINKFVGHTKAIRGLSVTNTHDSFVSCSEDCTISIWKIPRFLSTTEQVLEEHPPISTFTGNHSLFGVDHHKTKPRFVTVGALVEVWEQSRSEPIQTYSWGADTISSVNINPVENEVLATSASDRSIALYDLRMSTPIRKIIMRTRTEAISWNPLEAFSFTTANRDSNLYTYDMRKMDSAICVHQDFVSSVMDIDYSPTGREFVAGSYDCSIRIFPYNKGHSREIYHTKRMHRVFSVSFSMDGEFVFSGSDDMNVRIWKTNASKQQGVLLHAEKIKHAYNTALIERYKNTHEVNKIDNKRYLPKKNMLYRKEKEDYGR